MLIYIVDFQTLRPEEPLRILDERASSLKKILSRIPDEIYDRKRFLETIKYVISFVCSLASIEIAFSALTVLVGHQEGHLACIIISPAIFSTSFHKDL